MHSHQKISCCKISLQQSLPILFPLTCNIFLSTISNFFMYLIVILLYAGRKDLKWSLIPGSNSGRREPSFSRGFKLQCCSGFKPSAYEDPNMVTKCLGSNIIIPNFLSCCWGDRAGLNLVWWLCCWFWLGLCWAHIMACLCHVNFYYFIRRRAVLGFILIWQARTRGKVYSLDGIQPHWLDWEPCSSKEVAYKSFNSG